MDIYDRNIMILISKYGDLREKAAVSRLVFDKEHIHDEIEHLLGVIEAKILGKTPPFKAGDIVENTVYASSTDSRHCFRSIGEPHHVRRILYKSGLWHIEISKFGKDARFSASDFKKFP
jgi:hypothetical protein